MAFCTTHTGMRPGVLIHLMVGVAVACSLCTGCGYHSGQPFEQSVQTVHVESFSSKTFRRRLEIRLTEAVRKRINMETPYRLVADAQRADTLLSGEILEVRQSTLGRDFASNLPRETQYTLVVRFEWKDLRSGEVLAGRQQFIQTVDYIRPVGETEFIASQEALDDVAERIVEQMYRDF